MFFAAAATPATMESILTNVTAIVGNVTTNIGTFVNVITDTPYLMIGVSLMIGGAAVSFISRLIRA